METEEEKMTEPILVEEISAVAPEASPKVLDYIVRHASGKKLSEKRKTRGPILRLETEISKRGVDIQRQRRRRLLVLSP